MNWTDAPAQPVGSTLARAIEHLGSTLVDLLAGDPGTAGVVTGVHVHDPADPAPVPAGSIVLAVGLNDGPSLLALVQAAAGRAAAVVVRSSAADGRLVNRAGECGTVLLGLSPGASWLQALTLLNASGRTANVAPFSSPALTGELFDLANAICTLIDAPVTIDDRHGNVLAFSDRQEEADFIRVECILGRRTPVVYQRDGAARAIRRAAGPVYFEAVAVDERPTLPRLAVAIRAGEEFLGTIWAAVREAPTPDREQRLLEGSRLVAIRMLRLRGSDARRRVRGDRVAAALGGGATAATALRQLGLADTAAFVLAVSFDNGDTDLAAATDSLLIARRYGERQRIATALNTHLDASLPGSICAVIDDQIYAIVPARRLRDVQVIVESSCRSFLARTRSTEPMLIGIGRVGRGADDLERSRSDADRAVRVLRTARDGRSIAHAAEVDVEALLLESRDLLRMRGWGPTGAYAKLLAYDNARNASMLPTLRSWLDAHGDIVLAAENSHIHQNTLRYRLRRIGEIGGVDLDDPRTRLELALQLRLFEP
ncbi:PucR family transcriptional regulator [Sinosporangium siamense]|uniref:PucR family transcriptional regulator n=1 Tax=Sinosporangium siamense TaxID=1367973 RepID=A0A919RJX5_9ACTN|nr:helix-turn-helix domain-containing protein [Sinosporangium siamense]GII95211.1 PucR family transcriptional regulator [Sinosporangium siamense]